MAKTGIPSIVCIGGGTGQAQLLRGLKAYPCKLTAIVAVTDTGRSSGKLRKEVGILPPGDIRNCLVALSESEKLLLDLFQYRFKKGSLEGHSFGNLFIAALSKVTGSFEASVKKTSEILNIRGKVLPPTPDDINICVTLTDGSVRKGEVSMRGLNKPTIKTAFLEPENPRPTQEAIEAVYDADLIVIGPGSLYGSIITNLLIKGLRDAILTSKAKKVYVCNIMTQPGQTDGYSTEDHISAIMKYLGKDVLDYIILNDKIPPKKALRAYEKEKARLLAPLPAKVLKKYNFQAIMQDFIEKDVKKKSLWQKQHLLRHDSDRIAKILVGLTNPQLKAVILAAGEGTRLKPFSLSESKVMIKFLGKPLLAHHVDEFLKNGIADIIIVCSHKNYPHIEDYFSRNYQRSFNYVIQEELKGPAHAICCAEKYLRGGYIVYKYGDSLALNDELRVLLDKFKSMRGADGIVTLKKVKDPSEFSSARFEGSVLKELIEKPKSNFPSNFSHVGLGLLNAEKFFDAYKRVKSKTLLPPPEYLLKINCRLLHWVSETKRIDMGRVWNLLEANRLLLEKLGPQRKSSNISKVTHIDPTVYIGPNAIIKEGTHILGFSSIDCFVGQNTMIADSILMEGSKIGKNCQIVASVIGKHNLIEDNVRVHFAGEKAKIYMKGKYVKPDVPRLGCFTGDNVTIMEKVVIHSGKMVFPNKVVKKNVDRDLLIRAILFDADNTLYRTKEVAKNADMKAMRFFSKLCARPPAYLYKEWKHIVNGLSKSNNPEERHRKHSYSILATAHNIYSPNNIEMAFDEFLHQLEKDIKIMPGLRAILPLLENYKLAIITEDASDLTGAKIEALGLAKSFQLVLTSTDIGVMKPDPRYYKKVFSKFKVDAAECLVIGDDYQKDLAIPQKLGATTVCFGKSREADYSIQHYKALLKILEEV